MALLVQRVSAPAKRLLLFSQLRLVLTVVKGPLEQIGFAVLPRRWVVERTFAWLSFHRRLSKGYEPYPGTSEAFIRIAMNRLVLRGNDVFT